VDEVLAEAERVVRELAGLPDLADEGDDAGTTLPAVGGSVPALEEPEDLGAMRQEQRLEDGDTNVVRVRPTGEVVRHPVQPLEVLRTQVLDAEGEDVNTAVSEPAFAFGEQRIRQFQAIVQRQRLDAGAEPTHDGAPAGRVQTEGDELIVLIELAVGCRRARRGGLNGGAYFGSELIH